MTSPLLRIALALLFCASPVSLLAQDAPETATPNNGTLKVYLDCDRCDEQYIRTEVTFVNYVRDRADADVHLLMSSTRNGSGGLTYQLNYIGRGAYASMADTLSYASLGTDTRDEWREGLLQVIKMGLVRYVAKTPQAPQLAITFSPPQMEEVAQTNPEEDPWNFWIFSIGANGSYDAEETREFLRLRGNLSANRVTEDWKIRFWLNGNYRRSTFDIDDLSIVNTSRNGSFWNLVVKSLNDHWSAGSSFFVETSSFNNTDLSLSLAPAVEYNIFPYQESTRREFRISYRAGLRAFQYEAETIFNKTEEKLLFHEIEATLEVRQPWGEADVDLELFQYLHDFESARTDFYRVELGGGVNFRLVRGLSFFVGGNISWIRDQLFLPSEEATDDEILLRSRRLPTDYEYEVSMGFNYSFGSIFNNVVNPRFGF